MSVDVIVLDDGTLQATVDGLTGPALSIGAVQALAARIPDAQNALARVSMTDAVRGLTDTFVSAGTGLNATIVVTATALTATVDSETFTRLQTAMGVTPDPVTGTLTSGPVVVTSST